MQPAVRTGQRITSAARWDRNNQRNINARVDHIVNQSYRMFVSTLLPREDTPWQSKSGFQSDILAGHYFENDPSITIDNVITPRPDLVLESVTDMSGTSRRISRGTWGST